MAHNFDHCKRNDEGWRRVLLPMALAAVLFAASTKVGLARMAQFATYTVGVAPCDSTIQACIQLAADGDTIVIPSGSYLENVTLDRAVHLTGAGRETTTLRPAGDGPVLTVTGAIISNTVISGLTVTGGHSALNNGGGVLVTGSAQIILDSVAITRNQSAYSGGGLANFAVVTLTKSIVAFNVAQGSGGGGGITTGCYAGCRIYIRDTTINNNLITGAPAYGAGLSNSEVAELVNVTIHTNNGRQGGGIANMEYTSVMSLTNVTLTGNGFAALPFSNYSAIINHGTLTANNLTISGNGSAEVTVTGGIFNDGTFSVRNTIFANHPVSHCAGTSLIDEGGNLQFNPSTGCMADTGQLPSGDPKLGSLARYGGPTQTMALLGGSAAIDRVALGECPLYDQRGYSRTNACDSGAFEYLGRAAFSIFLPLGRK
jgi:hypothetical protein